MAAPAGFTAPRRSNYVRPAASRVRLRSDCMSISVVAKRAGLLFFYLFTDRVNMLHSCHVTGDERNN